MQNKYEVIGVVGEGAYGIVYKCKDRDTKEFVAIKKFKETEDEIVKKTMRRELKMLQLLKHENVVEFKNAFKKKGNLFLVFEYVEKNLLELLQESPSGLEPSLIKKLIYQLCKAIKYLHDQNVIHRDIKPENLLINNDMILKLCDFGFARKISMKSNETLTDYVATRWYRSPELLITNGYYGPEVDYWAIGCIMGELADGEPLFPGENETDQLHCIQKVLGNLPQNQVDMFYRNPLYNGKNLLDVDRPETLERRYIGKLPKIAINFMKGLLELDPNKRLNGKTVFSHPYFENYMDNKKEVKTSPSVNSSHVMISSERTKTKEVTTNNSSNGNTINTMREKESTFIKENSNPSINTTNLNIINYNTFNSNIATNDTGSSFSNQKKIININNTKLPKEHNNYNSVSMPKVGMMTITNKFPSVNFKKFNPVQSKPKSQQDLSSSSTSFNFNKQYKNTPNIISLMPSGQLTGYKTFFQNNKLNMNYQNSSRVNNNMVIEEEAEYNNNYYTKEEKKKKSKSLNPLMKTNTNMHKLSMYYLGGSNNGKQGMKSYFGHNANVSCYGGNFAKMDKSHFQLPSLGKMYNGTYISKNMYANKKYYHNNY